LWFNIQDITGLPPWRERRHTNKALWTPFF